MSFYQSTLAFAGVIQSFPKALVLNGKRVLFIENTVARGPKIRDASRIRERIYNWFKSTHGFTNIEKNLTIYSCLFIPLPYSKIAVFINNILISSVIKKWMRVVAKKWRSRKFRSNKNYNI